MNVFKKILISLITLTIFVSNRVSAQNEFGGVVKFDKTIHDFGDIRISDGEQKCTFTFTNISNKAIVVHNVITSCGCTDPSWTKKPVKPNERGEIIITFKNDQGPYPFDKSITVYISDLTKPVMLRVRGIAHEKKKSLKELFPERMGSFALRKREYQMGQIEQGLTRSEKMEVANISSKPIKIDFYNVSPGLFLIVEPNPIPANSKANLSYSINSSKTGEKLWGKCSFKASVIVDGAKQKGEFSIATLIKENFSDYTPEQRRNGALPQFNTSSFNFDSVSAGTKVKALFTCKNTGKENLIIYKMESSEKGATINFPETIAPGKEGTIEITIDTKNCPQGELLHIITVITNAPVRPLATLFVTGIIL